MCLFHSSYYCFNGVYLATPSQLEKLFGKLLAISGKDALLTPFN